MPHDDPAPREAHPFDAQSLPPLISRELSWLAFNSRVLDQAADAHWPLLERVKFLAIFGSNLDEFFMIRVSGLHDQRADLTLAKSAAGLATEELALIREAVITLAARATALWSHELVPALERAGIGVRAYVDLGAEAHAWAREHFRRQVFPVLTPLAVDPVHPFPFLSNLSLSLAVEAEDTATGERHFARVKVPESLERLVRIPHVGDAAAGARIELLPLEELIAGNVADLFPGMRIAGCWPFRVTRDMDIDILEDEAADLLMLVDREVRRRRFGAPVRLEVARSVPERIRKLLLEKLEIDVEDVYESDGLLGLSGLFSLAKVAHKELHDPPLRQLLPTQWEDGCDPFAVLAAGDLLLHHPYESFTPVLDLLRAASADPHVLAIKMTLYRAGSNSAAIDALIRAAENGKQVAVSVELKARFDEETNIGWARALERAGAHVFYGASKLKTHAKALLIVRREGETLRRYVHLSTGNYNVATTKLYTDLALLTTDELITEDVSRLFNMLSGFSNNVAYRRLSVAPGSLRTKVVEKIREQAARAARGEPARLLAKLNALVDPSIIEELYRASHAGLRIDLVVRGVCCLRPQVPGISDNIRVFSLIGRFLEHERVYVFGPPGEEELFLASADWMQRNLDRRVEAMFPILDPRIKQRVLREVASPLELDNTCVYEMDSEGRYVRREPQGAERVDGQLAAYDMVLAADEPAQSTRSPRPPFVVHA